MRAPFFRRTVLFLLIAGLASLAWAPRASANGGNLELTVESGSLDRTVLGLHIEEFSKQTVAVNGRNFLQVGLDGEGYVHMEEAGSPLVPVVCRSLMIPDAARMEVSVLAQSFYEMEGIDLISNRGLIPRTVDPATVPYVFGEAYERDAWYPGPNAALRDPYILRDVRGVVVEIFPFQYNPVKRILRVCTDLKVEVKAVGPGETNVIDRNTYKVRPDRAFFYLQQNQFVNGSQSRTDPPSEDGDLLIISHGPFMTAMQPLVNWKNSIGINTTIVDVATIGNNATAIKNYITGIYNQGTLAYVLLVGDSNEVRSGDYSGGLSDAFYSTITADWYPDIFVGRFSANTTADVDTQVERSVEYEQAGHDLSMGGWNTWGMGIGSAQGAGAGHYGEADYVHIGLIRDELLAYGFTKVDEIYDPSGTKSQVAAGLNEGRRVVNYCGHGSTTSWSTTGFSNTDVNALVNDNVLPFIFSVACVNGAFGSGTCFAEAWTRATHNGEPTGAVGCYMSSVNQSWAPPMYAEGNHQKGGKYGAAERFWMEMNWSLAGCWYGGSCCMMDLAGSSGRQEFMNWILFGDPSLRLTSMPALMMNFPGGVPSGIQPPGLDNDITVKIVSGKENYVPGSGKMHYRFDSSDPYTAVTVTPLGGDLYEVTLPNTKPGDEPQFYFSAQGDGGTTIYKPADAPASAYDFDVCFIETVMEDDFEQNTGWSVQNTSITTGAFERADPAGTDAQPEDDHSVNGTLCYVTGKDGGSVGSDDVDGGPTRLISPAIDLSSGDAQISFWLWFYHSDYGTQEPLLVHFSNDNGSTWQLAEQVGHIGSWSLKTYKVSDFVAPTGQVKIRFSAEDNPNDDIVEALVDDFKVERFDNDPSLWSDAYTVSAAVGDKVNFSMDAGAANGGRNYLLLGTLSGTSPGFTLPGGQVLPINFDALTYYIMSSLGSPVFQGFMGTLDGMGTATAAFDTLGSLDPALIGLTMHYAYLLSPPPGWDFTSNAVPLDIEP